jgi:hypothetical protein
MEKFATFHHANFPTSSYSFVHSPNDCALFVEFCLQTLMYQILNTTLPQGYAYDLEFFLLLYNPNPLNGRAFVSSCMFGTSNGFSPSMLWVKGFCGVVVLWLH